MREGFIFMAKDLFLHLYTGSALAYPFIHLHIQTYSFTRLTPLFVHRQIIHSLNHLFISALIHLLIQFHSCVDTLFFFFSFTSLFLYSRARFCPTFIPNRTFLIRFSGLQATLAGRAMDHILQ